MDKPRRDYAGIAMIAACLAIMAAIVVNDFVMHPHHEATRTPATAEGFAPGNDIWFYQPEPANPECDVTANGDWTRRDFEEEGKESSGAIGSRVPVSEKDSRNRVNAIVHGIICGDEERGANQHVLEGIMAAFYGGEIRHLTHNEWARTAHMVMEALWIPQRTRVFCGNDKPGLQTVYAHEGHDGQLRLDTTAIRMPRRSCYVWLSFMSPNAHEGPQALRLRANCGLQATTLSGKGAHWRMPSPQG